MTMADTGTGQKMPTTAAVNVSQTKQGGLPNEKQNDRQNQPSLFYRMDCRHWYG